MLLAGGSHGHPNVLHHGTVIQELCMDTLKSLKAKPALIQAQFLHSWATLFSCPLTQVSKSEWPDYFKADRKVTTNIAEVYL